MPSVQKVHIDKALTNISIGYSNDQFIANKVFPSIKVEKQSDRYYVYGMERFRVVPDLRAPGTIANEIDWTLSDDTYFCEGHALRHGIPDEVERNADQEFDLKAEATELLTEMILLNKEIDAANKVLNPNNYHPNLTVTLGQPGGPAKWSNYKDSNPVKDVFTAKQILHKTAGVRPNTLIMSEQVLNVLKLHPVLLEIINNVERGIVTEELIKAAFGIDNILVGSALRSDANPGQVLPGQVENLDYIWGNSVVLAYINPRPGRKRVSLGYTFEWDKDGMGAVQVRQWWEEGPKCTYVEAEYWYSQQIVSNVAAFLFNDAVEPFGL